VLAKLINFLDATFGKCNENVKLLSDPLSVEEVPNAAPIA